MFPASMSNSTSLSEEASVSSGTRVQDFGGLKPVISTLSPQQQQKIKKKRSLPGNPDPDAEVIALSPKTLLATNRFVCEICSKGFQRDQNLQLHRRGHNLPWKLKQRNSKEIKKRAYVCPEPSCVHHHPSRALGDLTGIKKHYCRKHGEKKWKCEKCSKIYAVQSDWKAHSKTCGTREYRCDCGTLFSRKDSFITHRAFCDALAEESARLSANQLTTTSSTLHTPHLFPFPTHISPHGWDPPQNPNLHNPNNNPQNPLHIIKPEIAQHFQIPPLSSSAPFLQDPTSTITIPTQAHHKSLITSPFQDLHVSTQRTSNSATSASHHLSATALLQKAATVSVATAAATAAQQTQSVGHHHHHHHHMAHLSNMAQLGNIHSVSHISPEYLGFTSGNLSTWQKSDRLTRDFLGLTAADHGNGNGNGSAVNVSMDVREMLSYAGGLELQHYERDHSVLKPHDFGFAEPTWGDC
ncbi:zf-C2H2 domain-containing protein [Cephalotus follicularis]|uniref:Zf-C2H2 domain-containing protein n=1 Tax=Cephalotus follicularis TaxID=3775 RepID=A0A1Q3DG20_CEPFO|nr:zf-C2H2 domain-containing protein [Cephalotus follicularis]